MEQAQPIYSILWVSSHIHVNETALSILLPRGLRQENFSTVVQLSKLFYDLKNIISSGKMNQVILNWINFISQLD